MQTYLERGSGAFLLHCSDRHTVNNGEIVRFGSVRCRINFGAGHAEQVRLLAGSGCEWCDVVSTNSEKGLPKQ